MGAPHPGPVAAMPMLPSYREAADRAPIPGNLKLYTRFHEKKIEERVAAAVGTLLQIWKISFSFALIHQCFSHINFIISTSRLAQNEWSTEAGKNQITEY